MFPVAAELEEVPGELLPAGGQGFGAPALLHGVGHLVGHEGEKILRPGGVVDPLVVGLHRNDAKKGPFLGAEGGAEPLVGHGAPELALALKFQAGFPVVEHRLPRLEHAGGQPHGLEGNTPPLFVGEFVHFVHEIGKVHRGLFPVAEGDVEVFRGHELGHDLMDRGIEGLGVPAAVGGLGNAVEGRLNPLGLLGFGDVAFEDQNAHHLAVVVPEGHFVRQRPEERPRGGLVALHEIAQGFSRAEHLLVLGEEIRRLAGKEILHAVPFGVFRRFAAEALDVGIGSDQEVVPVLEGDGKRGLLEDEAETLLLEKLHQPPVGFVVIRWCAFLLRHGTPPLWPRCGKSSPIVRLPHEKNKSPGNHRCRSASGALFLRGLFPYNAQNPELSKPHVPSGGAGEPEMPRSVRSRERR